MCSNVSRRERNECIRGFWKPLEGCKECYPPYTDGPNGACSKLSSGFITENDDLGLLCRRCKPSHYGGYCKYADTPLCKADGDTLAFADKRLAAENGTLKHMYSNGDSCDNLVRLRRIWFV